MNTKAETTTVTVRIFGREFKVKCPGSDVTALEDAAKYVDTKMRAMRGKDEAVASLENIAIVTALNIAHEFLSVKNIDTGVGRLRELKNQLRTELAKIRTII